MQIEHRFIRTGGLGTCDTAILRGCPRRARHESAAEANAAMRPLVDALR